MTLTIKVNFESNSGIEMEQNLNKAIDELSVVLEKKGICEMELDGIDENLKMLYKVELTKS